MIQRMNRRHLLIGLSIGLFLCQTSVESVAADEWVRVGGTHKYDRYVNMTSIGVWGPTVTLWTLRDFRVQRRPLHVRYYPKAFAQGPVLYAAPATREWSRVVPGSDDATEMKVACRTVPSTLHSNHRG
jgi:hypothetical protein